LTQISLISQIFLPPRHQDTNLSRISYLVNRISNIASAYLARRAVALSRQVNRISLVEAIPLITRHAAPVAAG
jgi:hypothetical protein